MRNLMQSCGFSIVLKHLKYRFTSKIQHFPIKTFHPFYDISCQHNGKGGLSGDLWITPRTKIMHIPPLLDHNLPKPSNGPSLLSIYPATTFRHSQCERRQAVSRAVIGLAHPVMASARLAIYRRAVELKSQLLH
jgi:hypothetical protein